MAICLLQFFILFLGCQVNSDTSEKLVFENNDFALKLYNNLVEQKQTNVIFSPLSISLGLAMTSLGAKGQTLKEIHSAIAGNFPKDKIDETFQQIMRGVRRSETFAKVIVANKLYAQKDFNILSSFKQSSQKIYESGFQSVDFSNKKESASQINNWVSEETDGIVKDIVKPEDLTSPTSLVLVSTLYFKAQWNSAFEKGSTTLQKFYVTPQKSVEKAFLHSPLTAVFHGHFNETLHYEILEIPFTSGEFRFGIILPDLKKNPLDEVEKSLQADTFKSHELTSLMANVFIPSFRVESTFDLSDNLKKLGISKLFEKGKADLSNLEQTKRIRVSKVLHKVVLGINEEGADNAAATTVASSVKSDQENPLVRINFRADHPFLFYIIDIGTGSLIYLGRYSSP